MIMSPCDGYHTPAISPVFLPDTNDDGGLLTRQFHYRQRCGPILFGSGLVALRARRRQISPA
jgi:hypothetical protein